MRSQAAVTLTGLAIVAAGCGSATESQSLPTGTVRVTFLAYPGPMPANGKPPANPWPGKATFTGKGGQVVFVTVPDTGKFTVQLAVETHTGLFAPTGLEPMRMNVRVGAGQTLKITVLCSWDSGSCGSDG